MSDKKGNSDDVEQSSQKILFSQKGRQNNRNEVKGFRKYIHVSNPVYLVEKEH
jgi:hypothetical protein